MKIAVVNGNHSKENSELDFYITKFIAQLIKNGHSVNRYELLDMKIKPCVGCWSCWVKTPGVCAVPDDIESIRREYITSDAIVFATPIVAGFASAIMKNAIDKLIPIALPYIKVKRNEMRHYARYNRIAATAVILQQLPDADDEDVKIVSDYFGRMAYHFESKMVFTRMTNESEKEAAHAFSAV